MNAARNRAVALDDGGEITLVVAPHPGCTVSCRDVSAGARKEAP
jgi:hypothetical protein